MLMLASLAALVVAASTGVTTSPGSLAPGGVGCEGTTELTLEREDGGGTYMSGFGKMICTQLGPGKVTAVLHKNGAEVARKSVETLDTNAIAAVVVPCADGPAETTWLLVVQYSDEWMGMWMHHRIVPNRCG